MSHVAELRVQVRDAYKLQGVWVPSLHTRFIFIFRKSSKVDFKQDGFQSSSPTPPGGTGERHLWKGQMTLFQLPQKNLKVSHWL